MLVDLKVKKLWHCSNDRHVFTAEPSPAQMLTIFRYSMFRVAPPTTNSLPSCVGQKTMHHRLSGRGGPTVQLELFMRRKWSGSFGRENRSCTVKLAMMTSFGCRMFAVLSV